MAGPGRPYSDWFSFGPPKLMQHVFNMYDHLHILNANGLRHTHEFWQEHFSKINHEIINTHCFIHKDKTKHIDTYKQMSDINLRPHYVK